MRKVKQIFCALFVTIFGVALLSACGSTKTPEVAQWQEISFEEFSAAFAARQVALWNHVEGTVTDDDVTYIIVEDLVDGNWVVDETKSTPNRSLDWQILTDGLITPENAIDDIANNTGVEYNFYQKGDEFKILGSHTGNDYTSSMETIVDQYFYVTYTSSDYTYGGMTGSFVVNATWSIK